MLVRIRALIFFLLLSLGSQGFSVPFAFTYAGKLLDNSGTALSGTQSVKITFWTAQTDGSQLAANEQTGATNDTYSVNLVNGVFSQVINLSPADFHLVFPDSTTGTWVQVEAAGITYPRQQFTAVPYALKVPVDNSTITYNSSGQLQVSSIGSVANLNAATTLSTTSAGSAAAPALFFGGDTNTGIYSSGADSLSMSTNGQSRLTIDSSGNVGIGTSSPTAKLEVGGNGSARFGYFRWYSGMTATSNAIRGAGVSGGFAVTLNDEHGTNLTAGHVYRIRVVTTGTATQNGALYLVYYDFSTSSWIAHFVSRNGSNSNHPLLAISGSQAIAYTNHSSSYTLLYTVETITTGLGRFDVSAMGADWGWQRDGGAITYLGGNVGIGTSTPTSKLQVDGVIGTSSGSAAAPAIVPTTDKNTGLLFPAADQVAISTGGTERVRVNASGSVGIGTAYDFAIANTNTSLSTAGSLYVGNNSSGVVNSNENGLYWHPSTQYAITRTNGSWTAPDYQQLRIKFATGIQIDPGGDAYGKSYLDILGRTRIPMGSEALPSLAFRGDPNTGISQIDGTADTLSIVTNGTERIRVDSNGRVGIGTSSPDSSLHVNGTARFENTSSGYLQVGGYGGGNSASALQLYKNDEGGERSLLARTFSTHSSVPDQFRLSHHVGGIQVGLFQILNNGEFGFQGTNNSRVRLLSSSGYQSNLDFYQGSSLLGTMGYSGSSQELFLKNFSATGGLFFETQGGSVRAMTIDSSGAVGIGTDSPAAKLDVAGEVKFGNTSSTCNSTNEGQQRYNSTSKKMEFCNGTAWTAYGTSTSVGVPAGTVIYSASSTAPSGYLTADGSAVSRTTYAELFAAIGTTFGPGNGSTTFNLPDLRGEFIRGLDNGRGIDSGRTLGSHQTDSFKSHRHNLRMEYGARGSSSYPPPHSQYMQLTNHSGYALQNGTNGQVSYEGGSETRPRNIALLPCIKY